MATKPSAILRIKDSSGSWREIPAIKGDSGVGIEKVENIDGKLKITLTDGRTTEFEIGTGSGGTGTGADGKNGLDGSKITNITSNEDGSITITVETPLEDGSVETKEYTTISLKGGKGDQGISITKTEINNNGELVITYSDNKTETLGRVVGTDGESIHIAELIEDPSGKYTLIFFSDGTSLRIKNGKDGDTPYIGENGNWYIDDTDTEVRAEGNSGVYVGTGEMPDNCNVQIDPSGEKTITLPNPHALTFTGAVTGSYDGSTPLTINIPDGNKITDIQSNADGSLTFVIEEFTEDGLVYFTEYKTKPLKGADGNDGAGIESIVVNDDYSLTITTEEVRNGNVIVTPKVVYTTPSLKGEQGIQGTQGENGADGADGKTPYIKDGNWWIGETDTGVKAQGASPIKGVDYWTSTDKAEIVEAATAALDLSSYATHEDVEMEIASFDFIKVLTELPESGYPNRIFLVPKTDTQTQDLFDEYVWINKGTDEAPQWGWEWVTTKQIEVDLTSYATKEYADTVLEKVYPIGSIYLTMSATNPTELFGFGEWALISNSFLIGAGDLYAVGATGGEATHTLSIEEMPAHVHKISSSLQWADQTGNVQGGTNTYYKRSESQTTQLAGGGQPHNNMPPYIAVYMWQRTA